MKTLKIALFILFTLLILSCKKSEVPIFSNSRLLFFPNEKEINKQTISFFHNQGKDKIDAKFQIALIGAILKENLQYEVEVVDSLTTAQKEDYSLDEKLFFRPGRFDDTLKVTLNKTSHLSTESVTLTLRLKSNANFGMGFPDRQLVQIIFSNIISKPEWWNTEVDTIYFGQFSIRKYEVLYQAAQCNTIVGLEPSDIREIALTVKKYIADNHITESNGEAMIIPCY